MVQAASPLFPQENYIRGYIYIYIIKDLFCGGADTRSQRDHFLLRIGGVDVSGSQLSSHLGCEEEAMQQSFLEPSNLQRIAWSSNQGPKVPFCESRAGPPMFFLIGKAGLIFALRFIAHVAWMRCLETCKLAKLLAPGKRCLLVLRDTF